MFWDLCVDFFLFFFFGGGGGSKPGIDLLKHSYNVIYLSYRERNFTIWHNYDFAIMPVSGALSFFT